MKFEIKSTNDIEETLRVIGKYLKKTHPGRHNFTLYFDDNTGTIHGSKTFIVRGTDIKTQAETFQSQKTINESIDICFRTFLRTLDLEHKRINYEISINEDYFNAPTLSLEKRKECASKLEGLYVEQNNLTHKINYLTEVQKKKPRKINVATSRRFCSSPLYKYAIEYDDFYILYTLAPSDSKEETNFEISDIKRIEGSFLGWER